MATKSKKATKTKKSATSKKKGIGLGGGFQLPKRIDFTRAEVRPGIVRNTYFLIVSGTKPNPNMQVDLRPLIYIQRPEFWGIEVFGTSSGPGLPGKAPYHVFIALEGTIGKKGIEVIGETKKKKIKVP